MCVLCMHMGKLLKIQTKWNNKHITKSHLFGEAFLTITNNLCFKPNKKNNVYP